MTNSSQTAGLTTYRSATRLTRRRFLKSAAASVAALPVLVPGRALGKDGKVVRINHKAKQAMIFMFVPATGRGANGVGSHWSRCDASCDRSPVVTTWR
jgi:hypothetical protein